MSTTDEAVAKVVAENLKATAERTPAVLDLEFLRMSDCWNFYRLRRGQVYNLIQRGKIRSLSLRERGRLRGSRLIVHQSLRDYLFSCEDDRGDASEEKADASKA